MQRKDCSRFGSLKEELINDWDKINLATKVLVFIGLILFIASVAMVFRATESSGIFKSIEVIFRSSVASIFGFVLSSNIKSNPKINEGIYRRSSECEDEIVKYSYNEGNSIQVLIAFIICIISVVIMLVVYILNIEHNTAVIFQLRDLMCTSIGFLLGESKVKK